MNEDMMKILLRQWKEAIESLPDDDMGQHLKILYLANMEALRSVLSLSETQSKIMAAIEEIRGVIMSQVTKH